MRLRPSPTAPSLVLLLFAFLHCAECRAQTTDTDPLSDAAALPSMVQIGLVSDLPVQQQEELLSRLLSWFPKTMKATGQRMSIFSPLQTTEYSSPHSVGICLPPRKVDNSLFSVTLHLFRKLNKSLGCVGSAVPQDVFYVKQKILVDVLIDFKH